MKAGFSKKKISPNLGILMSGHPGSKYAKQIKDDLFVRVAVINNDMDTIVFASLDVLFVEVESVKYIKELVCKKVNIKSGNIFISATHTHSGPMTTGLFGKEQETGYIGYMHSQTVAAIIEAANELKFCKVGFGKTEAKGFAFNARFLMKNGKVETHPSKYDQTIVGPEGPVDDILSFIYFYNEKGGLFGGIINYSNHPQIMERQEPSISADFPGVIEKNILISQEKEAVVLFINGTCGDICPVNAQDSSRCEVGEKWLEYIGAELAKKANEILNNKCEVSEQQLSCLSGNVELTIRDIPEEIIDEASDFLKHHNEKDELLVSNYGVEDENSSFISLEEYLHTNEWLVQQYTDLLELNKIKGESNSEKVEITVLDVCGIGVVMLPFEAFVEFGLEIKERSPYKNTLVAELTNGSLGYLPTEKAFKREGGYETLTMRSSRFKAESGKLIVEKAITLLNKLYGRKINNIDTQHEV